MNKKLKIKTGDNVIVIAGKDKGKTGNVLSVLRSKDRIVVEGVNIVKHHRKATQENPGKIEEKEASIHISNLSLLTSEGKITRVGYRMDDDNKVRFSKKTDEAI